MRSFEDHRLQHWRQAPGGVRSPDVQPASEARASYDPPVAGAHQAAASAHAYHNANDDGALLSYDDHTAAAYDSTTADNDDGSLLEREVHATFNGCATSGHSSTAASNGTPQQWWPR